VIQKGFYGARGVYAFKGAGLELLSAAKSKGLYTVLEQTSAPHKIWKGLLDQEFCTFPDWQTAHPEDPHFEEFCRREEDEWNAADVIFCGSEFVRECMAAVDGPVERCRVVPYGVDGRFSLHPRMRHTGPLRVLTVGTVNLNKGAPYVLEAAKQLRGKAVFRMVGCIEVSSQAERELRSHLNLLGLVPRSEILKHYAWADVFLLPSVCEGSATVTYEALAAGLPVICTPNTGSVVRNGVDGFVVPIRHPEAIVSAIELFLEDRSLLEEMSTKARETGRAFDLESYRKRLLGVLNSTVSGRTISCGKNEY
jgi:glycosyltransferase involved in cell wall biosynthesis